MAMLGICFVTVLVGLELTVVGTAMPSIVAELHGFDLYAWVTTAYLLTSVIAIPIFGRLGDYFGRKRFVITSVILFTAASLLCGFADSMLFLVIARGLQGIGGGMLVGTAFASIADLFPDPHKRLRWQVIMSLGYGISTAVGPTLGGVLTESWGWRWIFFINVPVSIISLYFVWRYLPLIRNISGAGKNQIDWFGAVLVTVFLGSMQFLVETVPAQGMSVGMGVLLIVCVSGGVMLWKWEQRVAHPIVPIDMFRDPSLSRLFLLSVILGFVMFALVIYAPLMLQGGFGLTPRDAGLLVTPLVACITVASIANGRIVTRLRNPNIMLYIGFGLLTISCLGIVLLNRYTSPAFILFTMLFGGLGMGLILPNITVFVQQTAQRSHLGIATATMQSLRMIGGMLGTAICGLLVNALYARGVTRLLETEHAEAWLGQFTDPEVLVNKDIEHALLSQMMQAGQDGSALLEAARMVLVDAIHAGVMIAVLMCLAGFVVIRTIPRIELVSKKS